VNTRPFDTIAGISAFVAAAFVAGASLAVLPLVVSVGLIAAAALLLVLAVVRSVYAPYADARELSLERTDGDVSYRLRVPRRFYYLGAATIGFLTVRPFLAFTLSDWVFLAAFAFTCMVLFTAREEIEYPIPQLVTLGVLVFSVGGLVSSSDAVSAGQSVSVVVRLLYLTLVWFWLGTVLLRDWKHVEYAVLAWVVSAALSASGAVAQFFFGDVVPGGQIAWGRMTGFTEHFTHLGGLVAIAFVPALMFAVDGSGRAQRIAGGASIPLLGAGLLLSGSVGGMGAAIVATLLWLFLRGVTRRTVVILGAATVCGLVLMSATGTTDSPSPMERILRVTSTELPASEGGTLYSRLDVYGEAWDRIQDHPLIGVGLDEGSNERALGPLLVHNVFLGPWFGAGILGLLGVVLLVVGLWKVGGDLLRRTTGRERSLVAALFSGVVAFLVFAMGEPILYVRYGWFPAAILVALSAQQRRLAADARADPSRPSPVRGARLHRSVLPGPRA
jgi:O-antigen ligase